LFQKARTGWVVCAIGRYTKNCGEWKICSRALRHIFANQWCAGDSLSLDYIKGRFAAVGRTQHRDLAIQMTAALPRLTSLVRILEQMHAAAMWCDPMNQRPGQLACSRIAAVAVVLRNSLQAIEDSCGAERLVDVHCLDWRFRTMPAIPP
jgi:hypothetical protein